MGKNLFKYIPLVLNLRLFNAVGGSGNVPQYRQSEKDTLTGGLSWCFSIPRAGGPTDRWFPHITVDIIHQSQLENKYGHCPLLGIVQS